MIVDPMYVTANYTGSVNVSYDSEAKSPVVTVTNNDTGQEMKVIPPAQMMDAKKAVSEAVGNFLDMRV